MRWLVSGLVVGALLLSACGARSGVVLGEAGQGGHEGPEAAAPIALYTRDEKGCPALRPLASTDSEMASKQQGEAVAVVELFHQDECTGAGGQYILAREVDGFRRFWLGGHGCRSLASPLPEGPRFGVVRYNQTAGLFHIDPGVCIGFPGKPPGASSDVTTRAVAVFETLDDARAFAASLTR